MVDVILRNGVCLTSQQFEAWLPYAPDICEGAVCPNWRQFADPDRIVRQLAPSLRRRPPVFRHPREAGLRPAGPADPARRRA